jgi:hypothetical protein
MTPSTLCRCLAISLAVSLVVGSLPGCSGRDAVSLQQVRGTVKYRGKSLDHGRVVFMPVQGMTGPPAIGEIQPDGSFQMQTDGKEGVAPGRRHVLVQCRESPAPTAKPQMVLLKSLIPELYSTDSSPLYFEVKSDRNEYSISLE